MMLDMTMERQRNSGARRAAPQEHLSSWSIENIQRSTTPVISNVARGGMGSSMSQCGSEYADSSRVNKRMPSSKVQKLASSIAELEETCQYFESRTKWLTKELLNSQKTHLEGTMLGHQMMTLQIIFHAWHERLHELSLEKQLEEKTNHLDQCQQVARDLGMALTKEQDGRKAAEMAHRGVREDLQRACAHEKYLSNIHEQNCETIDLMERWLREAEATLFRCRADSTIVIDVVETYQQQPQSLAQHLGRNAQNGNTVEQSIKLRAEAHEVMREVQGLLQQGVSQPPETAA